jgi:hypothetical protein
MEHTVILYPVLALAALTFGIALWMGRLRFLAVRRGDLSPSYYELNRGGKVPDYLAKVSQNYDNLLELPILFYVLACLLYVTDKVEPAQLVMAWLFVGSRYVHSYIHTTTNRLRPRMRGFLFGALILIVMWLLFALRLLQS